MYAEQRWAGLLLKLVAWWVLGFLALIALFLGLSAMKDLLASIPPLIQAACVLLVVLAGGLLVLLIRERRRFFRAGDQFLDAFEMLKPATAQEKMYGISPEKMLEIRRRGNALRGAPREWWQALDESLECYTSVDGRQGWFLTRPVSETLPEDAVVSPFYHSSFHQAVPGILTALGLLATFVAILMALARVTYNARDAVRPISGIDQLINGLSGKFLSSIIALILSVIFTLFEKKAGERQILKHYDHLVRRCKEVFPFLSQARILLDIQRLAVNQAAARGELEAAPRLWKD